MDAELEATATGCNANALHMTRQKQLSIPGLGLHILGFKLYIDYAGPVDGVMLWILIDAHSK